MKKNHLQRSNGDQRMISVGSEEQQTSKALIDNKSLMECLMEEVCKPSNLNRAYKRVKANKGAAGVDGMTVEELFSWISNHKESLIESLMNGSYQPKPVLNVEIPKPGG